MPQRSRLDLLRPFFGSLKRLTLFCKLHRRRLFVVPHFRLKQLLFLMQPTFKCYWW